MCKSPVCKICILKFPARLYVSKGSSLSCKGFHVCRQAFFFCPAYEDIRKSNHSDRVRGGNACKQLSYASSRL